MLPSAQRKASALAPVHLGAQSRGLRTPCERFAAGVTPGSRITRFRLAADPSPDGVGYPQGFQQGFEDYFTSSCPP